MAAGYTWLHIELRAETPVLAVKRGVKNWYTATRGYISSRIVIGALLQRLETAGYSDIYQRYLRGGLINASNFYMDKSLPAPVFSYRNKEIGTSKQLSVYVYEDVLKNNRFFGECSEEKVADTLKEADMRAKDELGELMEKAAGSLIHGPGDQGVYKSFSPRTYSVESVGIDGATYAGERGVLYSYEAYRPGTLFHGLVVVESGVADALKNMVGEHLWIGRGGSRGYGEVVFTRVEALDVEKLMGKSIDKPLIALSHLLVSSSPGDGFLVLSAGIESIGGWNRYYGVRKRWWRAHKPGSLIVPCRSLSLEEYMALVAGKPGYNLAVPYTVYTKLLKG